MGEMTIRNALATLGATYQDGDSKQRLPEPRPLYNKASRATIETTREVIEEIAQAKLSRSLSDLLRQAVIYRHELNGTSWRRVKQR